MTIGFTRLEWTRHAEILVDPAAPNLQRPAAPPRIVWSQIYRCGYCQQHTPTPVAHRLAHGPDVEALTLVLTMLIPCPDCTLSEAIGDSVCPTCLGTGQFHLADAERAREAREALAVHREAQHAGEAVSTARTRRSEGSGR